MIQRDYIDRLVEFSKSLNSNVPTDARKNYLKRILEFGAELAKKPTGEAEALKAQEAAFRFLITRNPQHVLWRIAGATEARKRALPSTSKRALDSLSGAFDLFGPLGCDRHEPSYSRILAFLMCEKRSAEVGRACQAAFLNLVSESQEGQQPLPEDSPFSVVAEHVGSWGRVDVAMESASSVVWVETKVDASEGPDQLARDAKGLKNVTIAPPRAPVLVFLTVDENHKPSHVKMPVIHLTFRDILRAWLPVASVFFEQREYLRGYLKSIAIHLYGLAAPGPFEAWPLATQRKALDFLEQGVEVQ